MRLEMEYLHLRNSIIFRAPARRVHLPRRLQLLTAIDARCLYLTRTLDVKLERSAIYVILDARWIEYEGIVIRSRVTRGILNYAVDTWRTSWNTTRKPSRVYRCARAPYRLLTSLSNLEQLVLSDHRGIAPHRFQISHDPRDTRNRRTRGDPNSSALSAIFLLKTLLI